MTWHVIHSPPQDLDNPTVQGISKLSGQAKASTYPQPEGTLGDAMANFGNKLMDFDNRLGKPQKKFFFSGPGGKSPATKEKGTFFKLLFSSYL